MAEPRELGDRPQRPHCIRQRRVRIRLTAPAEALFLSGLSGPVDALGLGATLAAAQLKLVTALPVSMRSAADRVRSRFHLDAPGWFHKSETPAHLRDLFQAVWTDRMIEIRYRSWKAEKVRRVAPLGLVLKGGAWYLVGAVEMSVRTYHVGRIGDLTVLQEPIERPAGFDLQAHWLRSTERLEAELHPSRAVVRLSPLGRRMIPAILSPYVRSKVELTEGEDGHVIATLPTGSLWQTASELLRFGRELEVLGPPELRLHMAETVAALGSIYQEPRG